MCAAVEPAGSRASARLRVLRGAFLPPPPTAKTRAHTGRSTPCVAYPGPCTLLPISAQRIVLNSEAHLAPPTMAEEYPCPLPCTLLHLSWHTLDAASTAAAAAADLGAAAQQPVASAVRAARVRCAQATARVPSARSCRAWRGPGVRSAQCQTLL